MWKWKPRSKGTVKEKKIWSMYQYYQCEVLPLMCWEKQMWHSFIHCKLFLFSKVQLLVFVNVPSPCRSLCVVKNQALPSSLFPPTNIFTICLCWGMWGVEKYGPVKMVIYIQELSNIPHSLPPQTLLPQLTVQGSALSCYKRGWD